MKFKYLSYGLLLVLTVNCGRKDTPKLKAAPPELKSKRALYLDLSIKGHTDGEGFDTDDTCDSLERSCFRFLGGGKVNYAAASALYDPGRWYRDSGHTCGPANGSSASGISRDMLLGLAVCLWQAADTKRASEVLTYADTHGGVMAPDGPESLTGFGVFLPHLYKAIVAKAQSTPLPPRETDPSGFTILTGYQAHLAVVGIYLDGLIYGGLTPLEAEIVKVQAGRQPRNALYQAVYHHFSDGDQRAATAVLLDESLFPADRLPSSKERSSSYLWERDEDSADWRPGNSGVEFSGTDFVFAAAMVEGLSR